jgi:two-component system response regulator DevR
MLGVYVVDDSALVRDRLVDMLSEIEGVEVVGQTGNPHEVVSAIHKLAPDVVILDIRMPGGSGIDVLRDIKKDKPAPIVIMLTNYPYAQYQKKAMDFGTDYFLNKSTEFEKITEILRKLVSKSMPDGLLRKEGDTQGD